MFLKLSLNATAALLSTTLTMQPRSSGGGGASSRDNLLDKLAGDILERMPPKFDIEGALERWPVTYDQSLNTVLVQEMQRFNKLIAVVMSTLANLRKALKGQVVMSGDLESVADALFFGRVPTLWAKAAYPSLKPLAGWVDDLIKRLEFLNTWDKTSPPPVFWLPGFFFTQAFLTGVKQNFARQEQIPIDTLLFHYHVLTGENDRDTSTPPSTGCYIEGIFMEGARWDEEVGAIAESLPKVLKTLMPIIWLQPRSTVEEGVTLDQTPDTYNCPMYKTSERKGVLSTTGQSTNFVMEIYIPSKKPQKHWVKRGVALLCMPD